MQADCWVFDAGYLRTGGPNNVISPHLALRINEMSSDTPPAALNMDVKPGLGVAAC